MRLSRRNWYRVARIAFGVIVLWFIASELTRQWRALGDQSLSLDPRWWLIVAASVLVLLTYALLIQLWRILLRAWGAELRFTDAARIWFVSSLGRYVPGKIWQIGAMAAMARSSGVSPVAATGTAILNTGINIAAGIGVALVTGAAYLDDAVEGGAGIAIGLLAAAIAGLVALPWLLPRLVEQFAKVTGRQLPAAHMPARVIWFTAAGNVAAWILYGLAFELFVRSLVPGTTGATSMYIAVYTGSYVVAYLTLIAPGGLGVREGVMAIWLVKLGLATAPQAVLVAFASRLWLTFFEVLPGLLLMARTSRRHGSPTPPRDVPY